MTVEVDVRTLEITHFTVGWLIALIWGQRTLQLKVRTRRLMCLLLLLLPSDNHSSWAFLLFDGHSKSACYSSLENEYAKLFNTPLNQLRQSRLVLHHIFYPLDLLSLSWPPFTSLWNQMVISLQRNGKGDHSAACHFFSPPVAAESLLPLVTIAASGAQTGLLAGFALTFLPGHFPAPPILSSLTLTSTDCPASWDDSRPCRWKETGPGWEAGGEGWGGAVMAWNKSRSKTFGCMRATSYLWCDRPKNPQGWLRTQLALPIPLVVQRCTTAVYPCYYAVYRPW